MVMGLLFAVLGLGGALPVYADELLWADRIDPSVPLHCRDPQLAQFGSVERKVFYGITGALDHGFTHEVELKRGEATTLWTALKSGAQTLSGPLSQLFDFLHSTRESKGYEFEREGDVLESLALKDLEREYPEDRFYTTGGISYHNVLNGKFETLGEVDVVVARRSDCAVIVVGEAKLGIAALHHAQKQVSRFVHYVKKQLCTKSTSLPICELN